MIVWIAKLLGVDKWIVGAVVVMALLAAVGGAYAYVDHRGYQRAAVAYQARIDKLVGDYKAAEIAETERQAAANNAAKAREASRIAEMFAANSKLETRIKELANEAVADPDAGKPVLGAPSVRRINEVR
ncbi:MULTISPECIES: hypothetical protein [unclassified Rhizobium]|uniref:hypothetical protein n=1 Tax=unclassified Rhizobium TaxID=2613769 RepID=UPI000BE92371|nr:MULTISPECIES: hypothetical protein [unclassified Rhizobium]MDF0659723.1 hypothetical protein [Rhizobium sp. BC49]PDS85262.1 hypothetical protein CO654_12370 [Rhizobium sp. L18]